jgi:heme-degrading monooxygenase HmoA
MGMAISIGRMMNTSEAKFCIVYRWKLFPGKESDFTQAWERLTQEIRDHGGGLGSRLHRSTDGTWVAYAQWPSEQAWKEMDVSSEEGVAAREAMMAAVEHLYTPMLLYTESDYLVGPS